MHLLEIIPNVLAMVFSLIAVCALLAVAVKLGGYMGTMLKYLVAGILLSVLIHALMELLAAFRILDETALMVIMGVLLTGGSICFIIASIYGFKMLKE